MSRDRVLLHAANRVKRMRAARAKGRHDQTEWVALKASLGHQCVACGSDGNGDGGIVKDHITPVYQGGSDAIENIQPLCGRCNARKGPDNTDLRGDANPNWRRRFAEMLEIFRG